MLCAKNSFTFWLLLIFFKSATAQLCGDWRHPKEIGTYSAKDLREASGLAFSHKNPSRLYHINDSNKSDSLFISTKKGKRIHQVELIDYKGTDFEDLSMGNCLDGDDQMCLYIADIGDNERERDQIEIILVKDFAISREEEKNLESAGEKLYPKKIPVHKILKLKFPGKKHDAESLAIHPKTGDLFLLTKETRFDRISEWDPSTLYYLPRADLEKSVDSFQTLVKLQEVDVRELIQKPDKEDLFLTSMDFNFKGDMLGILSKDKFFLFHANFSKPESFRPCRSQERDIDFQVVSLKKLPQQEAVAFIPGEEMNFLYTSEESKESTGPIMKMVCKKARIP